MLLSNPKSDYSSVRRMPSAKLIGQIQGTTTANTMPTSSSLQDISSHTHKFNWNKDQPSINLPESLLTSKNGTNNRHKNISHSDDRIFEHPEVTIKPPTLDEKVHRRLMMTTKTSTTNEKSGGSVPNILEHPDIRTPIVMETQQLSSSSSSSSESSSSSGDKKKLFRQQSADVYSTLARTTPPTNQTNLVTNLIRSNSPGSLIGGIVESPEQEKSEDSHSSSPPPTNKGPVQIIREYSRASSTSDIDPTGKHSNNKPQSEEDDFW